MKNWEKYEKEIKRAGLHFGVTRNGEIIECRTENCKDCIFYRSDIVMDCNSYRAVWLYADYKEPKPKLTREEKAIVNAFSSTNGYYYIARDIGGCLAIYGSCPSREEDEWKCGERYLLIDSELFSFITWESKAWPMVELKELEVEERENQEKYKEHFCIQKQMSKIDYDRMSISLNPKMFGAAKYW